MAGFDNKFDTDKPLGSDKANTLDTIIEAKVKKALDERYALEHQSLNSGASTATDPESSVAQGRHVAGAVSVLFTGSTADINTFAANRIAAGNPPGTGALALADGNELKYFDGSSFVTMGLTAEIYTAGVYPISDGGLTLTDGEFNVDFADSTDIALGTAPNKVISVADLKWAHGLTESAELRYATVATGAQSLAAGYQDLPLNVVTSSTIPGLTLSTPLVTMPVGTYEIEAHIGICAFDDNATIQFYQADWYDNDASTQSIIGSSLYHSGTSAGYNSFNLVLKGDFTASVETDYKLRVYASAQDITPGILGSAYIAGADSTTVVHTQVIIRKKKVG